MAHADSDEYINFRGSVPQRKLTVDDDENLEWIVFDAGSRSVRSPIVCLPPCSGTADVFFKQLLGLSALGYRIISVNYPVCWTIEEWCSSFDRLLDHLNVDYVHLFGASLGAFLAQKFTQYLRLKVPRVKSLILCNSFVDTSCFKQMKSSKAFWLLPSLVLRKTVLHNFNADDKDESIVAAIKFMQQKLDVLSQAELASRLTLNCTNDYIEPQQLENIDITLLDTYDDNALTWKVREDTYKCYPHAKRAHLKSGGNFPFLSRSEEVNMFIQIHCRSYIGSKYSPIDPNFEPTSSQLSNNKTLEYANSSAP